MVPSTKRKSSFSVSSWWACQQASRPWPSLALHMVHSWPRSDPNSYLPSLLDVWAAPLSRVGTVPRP
ncbi:unnamed protein product [Periconia digitata]|uniref:Uncharacterized protein n=1 Tax=Periconia digitata TaxID=1303443 RepID=A0A9W4US40_9PLEO|nr:unnamed protein product [Periconia digitata]